MSAIDSEFMDKHKYLLQTNARSVVHGTKTECNDFKPTGVKVITAQQLVTLDRVVSVRIAWLAMALILLFDRVSLICGVMGLVWLVVLNPRYNKTSSEQRADSNYSQWRLVLQDLLASLVQRFVQLQKGVIKFSVAVAVEDPVVLQDTRPAGTEEPTREVATPQESVIESMEQARQVISNQEMIQAEQFDVVKKPFEATSDDMKRFVRSVSSAETISSSCSSSCNGSIYDDDLMTGSPSFVRRRRASLTANRCFVSPDIRRMLEDVDGMLDEIEEIVPRKSLDEALADPERESNCSNDDNNTNSMDELYAASDFGGELEFDSDLEHEEQEDHDLEYDEHEELDLEHEEHDLEHEDLDLEHEEHDLEHEEHDLKHDLNDVENQVEFRENSVGNDRMCGTKHVRFVETPEVVEFDKSVYLEHKNLLFYSQAEIEAIGNEYFESVQGGL